MDPFTEPPTHALPPDSSAPAPDSQPSQPLRPSQPRWQRKKMVIGASVAIVALTVLAGAYYAFGRQDKQANAPVAEAMNNIKSASSALTGGAEDEAKAAETDDSTHLDEDNAAAAKIGDSIDENNL